MKTYYYTSQYPNYLMHFGVKGMKWGVRKYQNEDGTLTSEGEKRYGTIENLKKQRRAKKNISNDFGGCCCWHCHLYGRKTLLGT